VVAVCNGGRAQAPFVPDGTWGNGGQRDPAMNGWAIFRGSGATPETATGTGALPGKVPAVRPMAVWGGRTGQWAVEFLARERHEGGEVAERCGDNSPAIHGWGKRQSNVKVPPRDGRKILSSLAGLGTIAGDESQP